MFSDLLQSVQDTISRLAADPESRIQAIGTGILIMLGLLVRRRKPDRTIVNVNAPKGEAVSIKVGEDDHRKY